MAEQAFPGELWDIDQLAAHLKTSKDFVYTLTAQRRIGFLRVGKFIRFAPEHVRDYLSLIAVPAEGVHTGKRPAVPSDIANAAEGTRAFPTAVRNVGGRTRTPRTPVAPKVFS
jgi:excisionase family DNA binding protein